MTEPTNATRAEWAYRTVLLFAQYTGLELPRDYDVAISDLLADLMHLCDEAGIDFDERLDDGRGAYQIEVSDD